MTAGMTAPPVATITGDGYLHLQLNDPRRRNPLSRTSLAAIRCAAGSCGPETRALIISGAGGAFSAGADLSELTGTEQDLAVDEAVAATGRMLRELDLLVVAAVEGPCMGAAVDLALSADVIVAGRSAFFEVPAVRLGLLYNPEAVARWHSRLPGPLLSRLLLAGERVDAPAARDAGLLAQVLDDDGAVQAATGIAKRLDSAPRSALATTKRMLRAFDAGRVDPAAWQDERRRLLTSPERRAALERRRTT